MIKVLITGTILSIGIIWGFNWVIGQIENDNNTIKNNVGMRIVVDKDTSLIVDYSMLHETYTLSNGKEISIDLAFKLKTFK